MIYEVTFSYIVGENQNGRKLHFRGGTQNVPMSAILKIVNNDFIHM